MAFVSYEEARAVVEGASKAELELPTYTGSATDYAYLKQYCLDAATALYGVAADVFDTATVFSTTLLRDLVHRAIYHNDSTLNYTEMVQDGDAPQMQFDVAAAIRYPAYDACALVGWQMYTVFDAFGYETQRLASNTDSTFSEGHVLTEVFLEDYGKFAIQDATYNEILVDSAGIPLSMYEIRQSQYAGDGDYRADFTTSYVNYQTWGAPVADLSPSVAESIRDIVENTWFDVPYSWITSNTNTWVLTPAYVDSSAPTSRRFDSSAQAIAAVQQQRALGSSWEAAAAALRDGYSVSGFRTYSPDSARVTGEWLTVALKSGDFLSIDLMSGVVLNGNYLELLSEIAGTGTIMNSGKDLTGLLDPIQLMSPSGSLAQDWEVERLSKLTEISGTSASDTLRSQGSAHVLAGLKGNDYYFINDAFDLVWEEDAGGTDRVYTSVSYSVSEKTEVEELYAANAASTDAINLIGNDFTKVIAGNAGHNMLASGAGPTKMFGRGGDDTYYVSHKNDTVHEVVGDGYDRVFTTITYALSGVSDVEELAATSSTSTDKINLYGNHLNNVITGNAGANILDGQAGADTMIGLDGDDAYVVDNARDVVVEAVGGGRDTVFAKISYALPAGTEVEVLRVASGVSASQQIDLIGNGLGQTLIGHDGTNVLNARGGAGVVMSGLGGDDVYIVNSAADRVVEAVGGGYDTVRVTTSYALANGVEVERLETAAPTLTFSFSLTGNASAQTIVGNAGDNVLNGKSGNDVLTGGAGHDTFVFDTALGANNIHTITDFTAGEDSISLQSSLFGGLPDGALDAAAFTIGATATTAAQHIIYDSTSGALSYDSDGNGAAASVQFAWLTSGLLLSNTDFIVQI